MAVFLFEFLAILAFWRFADKHRMREFLPVILVGVFLRFMDQFIIIDWLTLWKVNGPSSFRFWSPITADVTIWPIASYLFLQTVPTYQGFRRWLHSGVYVGVMMLYIYSLSKLQIITFLHWSLWLSLLFVAAYFAAQYVVWRWLTQNQRKAGEAA